jgi:acyl-CoA synthetase (AMP-forming)/AMP-acid ligase II
VTLLRARAQLHPQRPLFTFLGRRLDELRTMTVGALDARARAVAAQLRTVAAAGTCVAVVCPNDLHFIEAFMGCQYAGVTPVPSPPLQGFHAAERLRRVLGEITPTAVVTTSAIAERLQAQRGGLPVLTHVPHVLVDAVPDADGEDWTPSATALDSLAFLQFTSGSLSTPKGVRVSHANILHNLEVLQDAFGHSESSRIVSWLPFFHDWGLIGGLLQPIYSGIQSILFDPLEFVRNPALWLKTISRYRATVSGAPNFAYDLCCDSLRQADCAGLDLDCWRIAIVGAEPIRAQTLRRFLDMSAACGFREEAFFTSYGLAESTLAVTGGPHGRAPRSLALTRRALAEGQVELTHPVDASTDRVLVSCGRPLLDQDVCIVDPQSRTPQAPDMIGEVWVAGPSVAEGYWKREAESREQFQAVLADDAGAQTYLRTGDQGFLHDGELYLTGRIKDLMIVNGRNLYPEDIERVAGEAHEVLRSGKGAAFSVEMNGVEQFVVAHEVEFGSGGDPIAVTEAVCRAVVDATGIAPGAIVLVRAGGIPRTSSGKIRRPECRQRYLAGVLPCGYTWQNPTA